MRSKAVRHGKAPAETGVGRNEWLVFRRSGIHGIGAFARVPIPSGTEVIEYVGERISKAESLRRCEADNQYIFHVNEESDLDGNVDWNPARYINHGCSPNCEAEMDGERILIKAIKDVPPGAEVTFNYGYDLEDFRDHPCRCGQAGCVGYIVAEEFFDHVHRSSGTVPGLP